MRPEQSTIQSPIYRKMTLNHPSNKKYTRCDKIIETPFYTLTNQLKLLKKISLSWLLHQMTGSVVVTRARIGHSFSIYYFIISKNPPPICDIWQADQSVQHIIYDCSKYRNTRINLSIHLNTKEALIKINNTKIMEFLT